MISLYILWKKRKEKSLTLLKALKSYLNEFTLAASQGQMHQRRQGLKSEALQQTCESPHHLNLK